jgi:hypothetical protein
VITVTRVLAALVALVGGCASDELDEPVVYACFIIYKCVGDEEARAREYWPTAASAADAHDMARETCLELLEASCVDGGRWCRVECKVADTFD